MKKRLRNKRLKQECINHSTNINEFIKFRLANKSSIFIETAMFLIFKNDCLERNRFKKNKYINYRLMQLVHIEQIFNIKLLKININDN